MTHAGNRETYLRWVRRASPTLVLPLALTAAVQLVAAQPWWAEGPAPPGASRYLFLSVGVAALVVGRNVRTHDTAVRPLSSDALVSLSWRLLTYALAPVVLGAVLVFMTRQVLDYYTLLLVTLVGLGLLFPRFDQWAEWATCPATPDLAPEGGDAA